MTVNVKYRCMSIDRLHPMVIMLLIMCLDVSCFIHNVLYLGGCES